MKIDLHTHTHFSHGQNSPAEMFESALEKGVSVLGFSEHSPRPEKFSYGAKYDYQEKLKEKFTDYLREVSLLKNKDPQTKVLLGIEQDFFPGFENWIADFFSQYQFDYSIGSVHFLGQWGYDVSLDQEKWAEFSQAEIFSKYREYFSIIEKMVDSRLFNIAAHLDLVKIFSIKEWKKWIQEKEAKEIVAHILEKIKENHMALEISSAGLRKPCQETYPGPEIFGLASEIGVDITLASDAHRAEEVTDSFSQLIKLAKKFNYQNQVYFDKGKVFREPISYS